MFLITSPLIFPLSIFSFALIFSLSFPNGFSFHLLRLVFFGHVSWPDFLRAVRARARLCLCERETFLPVGVWKEKTFCNQKQGNEWGKPCEVLHVRLPVKQASSLIWHLYRGNALFICPFFIFPSSFWKCRNTSWMCMEKWETYGFCGQTHCPPHRTRNTNVGFTQIVTQIQHTHTHTHRYNLCVCIIDHYQHLGHSCRLMHAVRMLKDYTVLIMQQCTHAAAAL